MEEFVVRMVEEENELKQIIYKTTKRMDKLHDFLEKVAEGKVKLTDTERCLLSTQAEAMAKFVDGAVDYDNILLGRIALYEKFTKKESNNEEIWHHRETI